MKKELSKSRDTYAELSKQHDVLKKKYNEEVDSLKTQSADSINATNEKIEELEQKLK
jgi:F0F1-type ATP synthase membrane subunit b/b'